MRGLDREPTGSRGRLLLPRLLCVVACLSAPLPGGMATAEPAPPPAIATAPSTEPDPATASADDATRIERLRGELDELRAIRDGGPSAERVRAALGVRLTDRDRIAERIAELRRSLDDLEDRARRIPAERAELEAEAERPPVPGPPEAPTPPIGAEPSGASEPSSGPDSAGEGPGETEAASPESTSSTEEATAVDRQARARFEQALARFAEETREFEARREERARRLAARRRSLEAESERIAVEIALTRERLALLSRLEQAYEAMSPASFRAFSLLGSPRTPLLDQASRCSELEAVARDTSRRLSTLGELASAGRLLGFRANAQRVAERSDDSSQRLADLADRLARARAQLDALAADQERSGRALQEAVVVGLLSGPSPERVDALYESGLRDLRALARRNEGLVGSLSLEVRSHLEKLASVCPRPEAVASVDEAEQILDRSEAALVATATVVERAESIPEAWRLAFAQELVTALEPLASASARREANRLSKAYLEDLSTETALALERLRDWRLETMQGLTRLPREWSTVAGRAAVFLALAAGALALASRRVAPMPRLIRWATRLPALRGRIGTVVRWGNLLQTIFPSIAGFGLLYLALGVLGADRPEIRILRMITGWLGVYWIGGRLLVGVTRPVSRGRPALIQIEPPTADLLFRTYQRLGLFLALVVIVERLAAGWLGVGRLRTLIGLGVGVWLVAWSIWAAVLWKSRIVDGWKSLAREGPEQQLASWMESSRLGWILTPIALVRLLAARGIRAVQVVLDAGGVTSFLRAKALRRLVRSDTTPSNGDALPERYLGEFPLYPLLGDEGALVLTRPKPLEQILTQVSSWRETRSDGSLVVVGEKGMGKTTLVAQLGSRFADLPVSMHSWLDKSTTERDVAAKLGGHLGAPEARSAEEVIEAVRSQEEKIVILDECHNLFLRRIGGYEGFDAFLRIVNATSDRIFWITVFNAFAWQFINQSRGRMRYFRRLLPLDGWSAAELRDLIERRNKKSGFSVRFDALLLDSEDRRSDDFRLIESADGYFRLLEETSTGNPRVALYYWLQSLRPVAESELAVGLFREPSLDDIAGLTDELLFVIAAVCQHENLSVEDLQIVLRMSAAKAEFAIQFLQEQGILEPKHGSPERQTLTPRYYPQVIRFLRRKHLLYEGKS